MEESPELPLGEKMVITQEARLSFLFIYFCSKSRTPDLSP